MTARWLVGSFSAWIFMSGVAGTASAADVAPRRTALPQLPPLPKPEASSPVKPAAEASSSSPSPSLPSPARAPSVEETSTTKTTSVAKPTKPEKKPTRRARVESAPKVRECFQPPVTITMNHEHVTIPLAHCDGRPLPSAVDEISILIRPTKIARPVEAAKAENDFVAPGIRRLHSGVIERLAMIANHFAKPNETLQMSIVSGVRTNNTRSQHAAGRALDLRIDGISNEKLVEFCKTLTDTGCGYYPNSVFVHVDVRPGAGRISWIDASGPGEHPRYVKQWPPKGNDLEKVIEDALRGLGFDDEDDPLAGDPDTLPALPTKEAHASATKLPVK